MIATIKMNLQYKIACIMVTGEDAIIGGMVAKELKALHSYENTL